MTEGWHADWFQVSPERNIKYWIAKVAIGESAQGNACKACRIHAVISHHLRVYHPNFFCLSFVQEFTVDTGISEFSNSSTIDPAAIHDVKNTSSTTDSSTNTSNSISHIPTANSPATIRSGLSDGPSCSKHSQSKPTLSDSTDRSMHSNANGAMDINHKTGAELNQSAQGAQFMKSHTSILTQLGAHAVKSPYDTEYPTTSFEQSMNNSLTSELKKGPFTNILDSNMCSKNTSMSDRGSNWSSMMDTMSNYGSHQSMQQTQNNWPALSWSQPNSLSSYGNNSLSISMNPAPSFTSVAAAAAVAAAAVWNGEGSHDEHSSLREEFHNDTSAFDYLSYHRHDQNGAPASYGNMPNFNLGSLFAQHSTSMLQSTIPYHDPSRYLV